MVLEEIIIINSERFYNFTNLKLTKWPDFFYNKLLLHFRIVSHMESSVFELDEDLMISMMSYFRMMMTEDALELNDAVSTFRF